MKYFTKVCVLIFITLTVANSANGQQIKSKKPISDTLQYLTDIIEANDTENLDFLVNAYLNRGEYYYKYDKFEAALNDCNKGLELDASDNELYHLRGNVYFALNELELAIKDYSRAIALKRENVSVLNRGIVYYHLKAFELARKDLEDYLEKVQDNAMAWSYYGSTLIRYRAFKSAAKAYVIAIRLDPEDIENYSFLGFIFEELGEHEKAEEVFLAGLEIDENDVKIRASICDHYLEYGKKSKIRKYCNFDDLSDSTVAHIYAERASKYADKSEYRKAVDALTMSIQLDSSDSYFIDRGLDYSRLNMFDSAIADYKIALQINPNDYLNNNNLGILYFELDRFEEAIEPLNKSIKLAPFFPYSYNNRALCYLNLGNLSQAKRDAQKSKNLDASNSYVYFTFAGIAALEGDNDDFYKNLKFAVENGFPLHRYDNSSFLDSYRNDKEYLKVLKFSKLYNN